jgi:hypothetical protein
VVSLSETSVSGMTTFFASKDNVHDAFLPFQAISITAIIISLQAIQQCENEA